MIIQVEEENLKYYKILIVLINIFQASLIRHKYKKFYVFKAPLIGLICAGGGSRTRMDLSTCSLGMRVCHFATSAQSFKETHGFFEVIFQV